MSFHLSVTFLVGVLFDDYFKNVTSEIFMCGCSKQFFERAI